jgi:RNA-directed DNA polymerase
MSEHTTENSESKGGMIANWREQLRLLGKDAFVRQEMTRLGFWPPSSDVAREAEEAEAHLRVIYDELKGLRQRLGDLEAQIRDAEDVPKLLAEIRRKRIERVRAKRAQQKAERAQERAAARERDRAWRQSTLPFLGRGVSAGLNYETKAEITLEPELQRAVEAVVELPKLQSAADVAQAIGISTSELAFLTYHRGAATIDHYHRFSIPKKRGGTRVISSPKKRLRVAQSWLQQEVLCRVPVHEAATAFRAGTSIVDNAQRHIGQAIVVRVDLKDFFPSITFRRVKRLFQQLGYNEGVASIFALLTTEAPRVTTTLDGQKRFVAVGERCLPQGACTSPAITNILCRRLDARLSGLTQKMGWNYSRYADDLVFSSHNRDANIGALLHWLRRILREEGLQVNEEKTRVMRPQHRQAVTGLVVNQRPHISRDDRKRFRAFLHQYEKLGREAMTEKLGQDAQAYAAGYLSFMHMVDADEAAKLQSTHPWLARWEKS